MIHPSIDSAAISMTDPPACWPMDDSPRCLPLLLTNEETRLLLVTLYGTLTDEVDDLLRRVADLYHRHLEIEYGPEQMAPDQAAAA